jgi:DNA-binding MarR family transcriptional regulator
MSRSPRKNRDGGDLTFSPIFDLVAAQYGLVTAAVYGVVHRHCQLRDGVCRASIRRLAQLIGVDRATVLRHLHKLVEEGFLEDLTPDQNNKPHIYRDVYIEPIPRPAQP